MKPMMIFHSGTVDASSVGSHDAGTNLDMAAFCVSDLKCITAGNTSVELTFADTGMFAASSLSGGVTNDADDNNDQAVMNEAFENSLAILTVTDAATATKVVKDIVRMLNGAPHTDGMFLFDAVNDVYPGAIASSDISAINIRRTTTTRSTTVA